MISERRDKLFLLKYRSKKPEAVDYSGAYSSSGFLRAVFGSL